MNAITVLDIIPFQLPSEAHIQNSTVNAAVFGGIKGRTAHLKLSYRLGNQGGKKALAKKEP